MVASAGGRRRALTSGRPDYRSMRASQTVAIRALSRLNAATNSLQPCEGVEPHKLWVVDVRRGVGAIVARGAGAAVEHAVFFAHWVKLTMIPQEQPAFSMIVELHANRGRVLVKQVECSVEGHGDAPGRFIGHQSLCKPRVMICLRSMALC